MPCRSTNYSVTRINRPHIRERDGRRIAMSTLGRLVPQKPESPVTVGLRKSTKRELAAQRFALRSSPVTSDRDSYASTALGDVVDRSVHAALARFTLGLSPAALAECYLDWATHLASSPGKQMQLLQKGARKFVRLAQHIAQCGMQGSTEPCIQPLAQDRRFVGEGWQQWPYNLIYQSFLLQQQ